MLIQRVIVTDDRRAAAEGLRRLIPAMSIDEVLDSPFLLIGTYDEMAQALRERRDRFGVSYWVVFAERPGSDQTLDTLAPVIDALVGPCVLGCGQARRAASSPRIGRGCSTLRRPCAVRVSRRTSGRTLSAVAGHDTAAAASPAGTTQGSFLTPTTGLGSYNVVHAYN